MPQLQAVDHGDRDDGPLAHHFAFAMGATGALATFSFFLATQLASDYLESRAAVGFYTFIIVGLAFAAGMLHFQLKLARILIDSEEEFGLSITIFLTTLCVPIVGVWLLVNSLFS